jgi:fibronectin type 3 domain-containing protein
MAGTITKGNVYPFTGTSAAPSLTGISTGGSGNTRLLLLRIIYLSSTAISTAPTSVGGTWTLVKGQTNTLNTRREEVWQLVAPSVQFSNTTITVTLPSSVLYIAEFIETVCSGSFITTPIEASATVGATFTTGTVNVSQSITTQAANDAVMQFVVFDNTGVTVTAGTGFTANEAVQSSASFSAFSQLSTAVYSSAGTQTAAVVNSANNQGTTIAISIAQSAILAPAAPTSSTITTTGMQVNPGALTSGATSCNIQATLASDTGFASPVVTITGATVSANNAITGLTPGTNYIVRTQMVNGSGTTNGPATSTIITLCNAPTGLVVAAVANSQSMSLSWTAATGAVTYNVLRSTTNGSGYATFSGSTGLGTNSFTDTTASPGNTNFYYVVVAVNASGNSANSAQGSGLIILSPDAPSSIVATAGNNQVVLTWVNSVGTTGVNIKRSTTLGGTYTTLGVGANIGASTFTDITAANGSTYYYKISSINSLGNEGPNSGTGQGGAVGTPPPTSVTNTQVSNKVTVGWTPPSGGPFSGYNIYRLKSDSMNGVPQRRNAQPFVFVAWGTTSYDDFSVVSGYVYTYYVATVNGTLESVQTAPVGGAITLV